MRTFTLTLFALFFTVLLSAQITPFMKKFGTLEDENIWKMKPYIDDTYFTVGTAITSSNERQTQINRIDLDGNILSTWEIGQPFIDRVEDFTVLSDGSLILIISAQPYAGNQGVKNLYICRISPSGMLEWANQFGDEENYIRGMDIHPTSDGNFLVSGHHISENSNDKGILLKFSANGSILFRKHWDQSLDYDRFDQIAEVGDGYLVTGYSDFPDPDEPVVIPVITKFDFNGNLIWSNAYDDGFEVRHNNFGILTTEDDDIFVAYGSRGVNTSDYVEQDIVIMRLENDGNVSWANRYGNTSGGDDVDDFHFDHDGNLLVNGDLQEVGFGEVDGYVLRVDRNGDLIDVRLFGKEGKDCILGVVPITKEYNPRHPPPTSYIPPTVWRGLYFS